MVSKPCFGLGWINMNSWPGGKQKPLTQYEHSKWNAHQYPGTRQLCCECEQPTNRCEEDDLWDEDIGPYCSECYSKINL